MFEALCSYFYELLGGSLPGGYYIDSFSITLFNQTVNLRLYLATTLSLIALIIIIVLCCLFIKKIISLTARLFTGF